MYYTDDTSELIDPPANEWKPIYWTPRKYTKTLGDDIADFTEKFLSPPRKFNNEPFKLSEWQRWLFRHMFELKPNGTFRYTECYIQIPRKNGKSMIASALLAYFAAKARDGDELYVAAKDSKQAEVVFREVKKNIGASHGLSLVLDPKRDVVQHRYKNAFIKKLSSSAKSTFGFAPYISVGDELWAWDSEFGVSDKGREMIASLTTGSGDRPEYMFIGITTAGSNTEGLAAGRYEKGKLLAMNEIEDDSFGFFCWEAEDHDDITDPKTWIKANPSLQCGIMDLERFEQDYISSTTFGTADFERFRLNRWIRLSESENFIEPSRWKDIENKALGSISKGSKITVGFDGSLTEDSTGIVAIDYETGLMEVLYKWEKDPTVEGWFVDVNEVQAAIEKVFKEYDVLKLYADPSRHQDMVKGWIKQFGKSKVRDIPPHPSRMVPMSDTFRNDVYQKNVYHNGNKRFSQHVLNAIETERGLPAKEKRNSPKKIDFLVCAILANGARTEIRDIEERKKKAQSFYNR